MPKSKKKLLQRAAQKFRKEDPERYSKVTAKIVYLARQYK